MITWTKGSFKGRINGQLDEMQESVSTLLEYDTVNTFYRKSASGTYKPSDVARYLRAQFRSARMRNLDDIRWRSMANTDSYFDGQGAEVKTFQQLFRNLQRKQLRKNVSSIVESFIGQGANADFNGRVECPIAVKLNFSGGVMEDGRFKGPYYLVGGNTRLTVAKILGIQPKIIEISLDW